MRARKATGSLVLLASILVPMEAQQVFTNQDIKVTYPSMVSSTPGQATNFQINAQALPGSQHNVWTVTRCTGANVTTSPQFQSLLVGSDTTITGTIAPTGSGIYPIDCSGRSGPRGGEDVAFNLNSFSDVQQAPLATPMFYDVLGEYVDGHAYVVQGIGFAGATPPPTLTIEGSGDCLPTAVNNPLLPSPVLTLPSSMPLSTYLVSCDEGNGPKGAAGTIKVIQTTTAVQSTDNILITGPGTYGGIINGVPEKDPVSTATGELYAPTVPTFLSLGGPLPLQFRRYYASLLNNNQVATHTNNWTHNFESFLNVLGPVAVVVLYDGKRITFQQSGGGYKTVFPEQYDFQLVSGANNTYQFLDPRTNLIYTFSGATTGTGIQNLSLAKIQDRNGNSLTVTQGPNGPTSVTDGLGRSLTFTYDSNGNLTKVVDQTGRAISFAYSSAPVGKFRDLLQITDANGKQWNYAYTSVTAFTNVVFGGLMTSATLPLGNKPFTQTWNPLRQVATQTDSRGNTTAFTYDQPKGSSSYKDPSGAAASYTSAGYNAFLTYTDPDGQTVSATYDGNQHRDSVTDRLGDKVSVKYDVSSGRVTSHTDAAGRTTSYTWTAQVAGPFTFHNLTQVKYADGTSISLAYDANGNVTSMTDQAGKVTKYAYNNRGQLISVTDPNGRVATSAYNNADATLASITDPAGNIVKYAYDSLKRVNLITFADGSTRSYVYDNLDNIVKTVDERGKTTTFAFNDNDKLQTLTDALGQKAAIAYNTDELPSKQTDRTNQITSYAYDPNNLLQSVTTPAGETFTFNHDSHYRVSAALDPAGNGLQYAYDKEDVLASVTDALGRKISFITDHLGYPIQITTPLNENYTITRDALERVTSATDPAGIATTANYDARGLLSAVSIGGLSSSFSRDDSGLLTGVTDPGGSMSSYNYDSAGRLASRTDPLNRVTQYSYDKRNRVSGIQLPLGTVAFTRDANGNIVRRLYSDGTDLNYTYDDNNRLTGGSGVALTYDAEARITGSNGLIITLDGNGRINSITYAPGKTVTYTYNSVGLLASVTDWVGGSMTFSYDAAHQLTSINRSNGLGTQYTYDMDGRIASITEDAGSSIMIQRDAAGKIISVNRTQPQAAVVAPGILPLAYDAANQVSGFTYDDMGRLTSDNWRTYQWDLPSRLKSYSGADGAIIAAYDGFGLRTSAGSQNFVWNYATRLPSLATVQNSSGDQRYYVYSPGGTLLYAIDASTNARHFYHFDENGSTVLLTDDSGTVTDSYGVTPYGETVTHNGSTDNPFTWLGQLGVIQEGSTGLYYMRARYYDSATARFLSPDPIRSVHPLKANPYEYARANPLGYIDPRGTDADPLLRFLFDVFHSEAWAWVNEDLDYEATCYQAAINQQSLYGGSVQYDKYGCAQWIRPEGWTPPSDNPTVDDSSTTVDTTSDYSPYVPPDQPQPSTNNGLLISSGVALLSLPPLSLRNGKVPEYQPASSEVIRPNASLLEKLQFKIVGRVISISFRRNASADFSFASTSGINQASTPSNCQLSIVSIPLVNTPSRLAASPDARY